MGYPGVDGTKGEQGNLFYIFGTKIIFLILK